MDYKRLVTPAGLTLRSRLPGRASLGVLQTDQSAGGLRVSGPTPIGSAAYRAGIDVDDVIKAVGAQTVGTDEQLDAALKKFKPGDRITVTFVQRGQLVKAEVALDQDPRFDIVTVESAGGTLTRGPEAFRASWLAGSKSPDYLEQSRRRETHARHPELCNDRLVRNVMLRVATACPIDQGVVGLMLFRLAHRPSLQRALTLAAQQPPAAPPADQSQTARFGTATSGVVVDVVCATSGAGPSAISPRQSLQSSKTAFASRSWPSSLTHRRMCHFVSRMRHARRGWWQPSPETERRLSEGPPVIALAWDRLEPEGRALAYKAARRLVQTKAPGELVGVFLTDMTLRTVQPYTTDAGSLAWPWKLSALRRPRR